MSAKEKSALGVSSTESGRSETEAAGATVSNIYFTMKRDKTQGRKIADLLPYGEANAIPSNRLVDMLGCRSVRQLQQEIAAEVEETGALILASPRGGYFLAETRGQADPL